MWAEDDGALELEEWPLHEALLWIALRNLPTARHLASVFRDGFGLGQSGQATTAVLAYLEQLIPLTADQLANLTPLQVSSTPLPAGSGGALCVSKDASHRADAAMMKVLTSSEDPPILRSAFEALGEKDRLKLDIEKIALFAADDFEAVYCWRPDVELRTALRDGSVTATALRNSSGERTTIDRAQWEGLQLVDDRRGAAGITGAFRPALNQADHWTDLRFASKAVMAAFPPSGGMGSKLGGSQTEWHTRPGETQKAWVFREEVTAEASRRLQAASTSKSSLNGILAEMASECGAPWSQDAIASTRRRAK